MVYFKGCLDCSGRPLLSGGKTPGVAGFRWRIVGDTDEGEGPGDG